MRRFRSDIVSEGSACDAGRIGDWHKGTEITGRRRCPKVPEPIFAVECVGFVLSREEKQE